MPAPVVAVVGPGHDVPDGLAAAATTLGSALARAGVTVVCGGLGGVMESVAAGVRAVGGTVVGLLPGVDRRAGNPHLSLAVATGLGEGRNLVIVRSADVVVALGGGYGTLSEVAFALKLGRPVIGYRTWELAREGRPDTGIEAVESIDEVVDRTLRRLDVRGA